MDKTDVDTLVGCSARLWLDEHPGKPLSPFATPSPGPCCAVACAGLSRCTAGKRFVAMTQPDTTCRECGAESAASGT